VTARFAWASMLVVGGTALGVLLVGLAFLPGSAWESFVPIATIVGGLGVVAAAAGAAWIGERQLRPLRRLVHAIETDQIGRDSLRELAGDAPPEIAALLHGLHLTQARLRRTLAELEHDRAELRRAEAARRDFVANVSHELRTPVAALKALVETLEAGAMEDPVHGPDFLRRMHVEVDGLAQLVSELLDLARLEAGRLELQAMPVSAEALVHEAVERVRPHAERLGLELAVKAQGEANADLLVQADPRRIGQVLSNLLANAVKFTPAGGRIEAGARTAAGGVEFWVADTGAGLDPDQLSRVFERFYKTDLSRAGEGTGLGLAISKHLVQAHGGRIWADSPGRGHGATFYFTLPPAG
jgi:signal transduction histidine kinase